MRLVRIAAGRLDQPQDDHDDQGDEDRRQEQLAVVDRVVIVLNELRLDAEDDHPGDQSNQQEPGQEEVEIRHHRHTGGRRRSRRREKTLRQRSRHIVFWERYKIFRKVGGSLPRKL
jgi:hypothetical protein